MTRVIQHSERATEEALEAVEDAGEVLFGAVDGTVGEVRRAYRRGQRRTAAAVEEVYGLPERALNVWLRVLRRQSASRGPLAPVARRVLLGVHQPSRAGAEFLSRVARASTPASPSRRSAGTSRRTGTTSRRGRTQTTARGRGAGTSRRTTGRARRAA